MLDLTVREEVRTKGYIFLTDIELSRAHEVTKLFGRITADRRNPDPLRRISPQPLANSNPNTLSSRYGLDSFPFHTEVAHWETPADYLFLFCEDPGGGSRPTELIDTRKWPIDSRLRYSLLSNLWKTGHRSPKFCTVGCEANGDMKFRYDTGCMRPAGRDSAALHDRLQTLISCAQKSRVSWARNALLIIDNKRMLHARGVATRPDQDRVLVRILIGGQQ